MISLALAACGTKQKWSAADISVSPEIMAREISPELAQRTRAEDVPDIPALGHLRPCCAFGTGLHVSLMSLPVLGVQLTNVIGPDQLGPHKYDNGALAFEASRPGGPPINDEHNGLVYTCRGGFIDTAHVRDWADWTLYLGAHIARSLEQGLTLELPSEGGRRRITVKPIPADVLAEHDRREIAVPLAQWIAFQLSVWHEIATWYGWSALALFPEEASAFSPEDLYSNLIGIKLAGSLVYQFAVTSEAAYNEGMSSALALVLERLGAVPGETGQRAARAVDGQWWDSRVALPAKGLVTRRNLGAGSTLTPWLVQQVAVSNENKQALIVICGDATAVTLRNPDTCVTGKRFEDYAEVEVVVDQALSNRGFPFPEKDSHTITQRDFPAIIEKIREQNAREFGESADRPD